MGLELLIKIRNRLKFSLVDVIIIGTIFYTCNGSSWKERNGV